jgi:DNA-binding response OmpR family regulator
MAYAGMISSCSGLDGVTVRLLLVEDSPRLQRSLSTRFRQAGYAVDATGDGADGLRLARTHDYGVIILDLMIPALDCLSVLQDSRISQGRLAMTNCAIGRLLLIR